jgi:hypothetical protein
MDIYLGFDPGGENRFGWAVCSSNDGELKVICTGIADHAKGAVAAAVSKIPENGNVNGVGIDAPLFWITNGGRRVDEVVRDAINQLGAPYPGGTVQQVNSLRGACLVQGVLVGKLLRDLFPSLVITESHPKALLYLLGIAHRQRNPNEVAIKYLSELVISENVNLLEHERDAVLGALSSWAGYEKHQGWRDLFKEEVNPVVPFNFRVSYWMPWNLVE